MTPLGSFSVRAEPAEVAAFRAATGLPPGETVPMTFPMRWLAAPEVRERLLALAPEGDLVPVHESQSFDYTGALHAGETYAMRLDARRDVAPDRLVLAGTIEDGAGVAVVQVETILRLFSTSAA